MMTNEDEKLRASETVEIEQTADVHAEEPLRPKPVAGSILTYTNHRMYPALPKPEDFRIFDIAHALSMMVRANGHFKIFYSVGQHSLNCSYEAEARGYSKRIQLALLLHDAAEAYISDVTRPVKLAIPEYTLLEKQLDDMIFDVFRVGTLVKEERKIIDEIDTAFMLYEFEKLHTGGGLGVVYTLTKEWPLEVRDMKDVEHEFMDRFRSLAL